MPIGVNNCKITIYNPSRSSKLDFNQAIYVINKVLFSSDEISYFNPDIFKSQFTINSSPDFIIIKIKPNTNDQFKFKSDNTSIEIDQEDSLWKITLNSHGKSVFTLSTFFEFPDGIVWIHILFEPIHRADRNVEIYKLVNETENNRYLKTFIFEDQSIPKT